MLLRLLALSVVWVAFTSCGPGPSVSPRPAFPGGGAYVVYSFDDDGLYRTDTRTGRDSLVAPLYRAYASAAVSPNRRRLALGYSESDSSRVIVIDLRSGAVRRLHALPRQYSYTLAWSPDGEQLAVGYHTLRRQGRSAVPDRGDIVALTTAGENRRTGCSVSKIVYQWLSRDRMLVGDGWNHYLVDAGDCRTLATIRAEGKRDVAIAPDASRYLYFTTARTRDRRSGRIRAVTELRVADISGSNDLKVIGDGYAPARARWSPDGRKIVFDVLAPESRNLRHIASYDLGTRRVQSFPTRTAEGVPSDMDAHWAPDGERVAHDRILGGVREKVVRTLVTARGGVRVAPSAVLVGDIGITWGWVAQNHLVSSSDEWIKIVDASQGTSYTLPVGRQVLHVYIPN